MPTEIFEDTIDLDIELLETVPIEGGPAYPMPHLRKTGAREKRTFRVVILENAYLRVTIIPALGGRIWSIYDKRTGAEILPTTDAPAFLDGGRRSVTLNAGITLRLDGEARLNDLGAVATTVEEGEEPAVWLAETSTGRGFAFHQRISIPSDRAEVVVEARIQHRGDGEPYNGELAIFTGPGSWVRNTFYSKTRKAGIALFSDDLFAGVAYTDGCVHFRRFSEARLLGTRNVDTWTVRLIPVSGLDDHSSASLEGAAFITPEKAQIQTVSERIGHKAVLLTSDGRTLEAPVDLYPEHFLEIASSAIGGELQGFVLLDPAKEQILRASLDNAEPSVERDDPRCDEPLQGGRHAVYAELGAKAMRAKDFAKADAFFEKGLMYNADDPLLWWEKGVVKRLVNPEEENIERLNAHFLAPLEPALRAEAFLSQPLDMGKEKSPLLTPLEETPEDFVEVACLYIERGLLDQASRWIDEALRHVDLPMLRILMAYCLIKGTRMDAEAAQHLAAIPNPSAPYPWRSVEREALVELSKRFPTDSNIARFLRFVLSLN